MNSPEKEHFLKIYRDMLEFKDGFDDGIGAAFHEYSGEIAQSNSYYEEMGDFSRIEAVQSFDDFFMDYIRPIYKKIDDWLSVLPAAQQKEEVLTLRAQINHYIGLAERYVLKRQVLKETDGIKKYTTIAVSLSKKYPVIKNSLVVISGRLGKFLYEEQLILSNENQNTKNKEFTTARQVVAILLLNQEFKFFRTQDKVNIEKFVEFLTNKTPRDIGDFIRKFNEDDGSIHKSKKQNQKDYEFLKEIFQKADCTKVSERINSILLKISTLSE